MAEVIDLQLGQMVSAYIFIILLLAIVRARGIAREKEILISAIRMTVQLMLIGYILIYLFDHINVIFTVAVIIIMEAFAIANIYDRTKAKLSGPLKKLIALSMVFGTLSSLMYFLLVVVQFAERWKVRQLLGQILRR